MKYTPKKFDIVSLRKKLGLTQVELADLLGVSEQAVQSWESGRRNPSVVAEKALLALIAIHRLEKNPGLPNCWEREGCAKETCKECSVYQLKQGHLCWFITGNSCSCKGIALSSWSDKKAFCSECDYFNEIFN